MPLNQRTSYHPHFLIAFYLNCLPREWSDKIPWSTRHDWLRRDQQSMFGYQWSIENQQMLKILQQVAGSRRLLRVNRALLRLIALKRFMTIHASRIKENAYQINDVVLNTIEKLRPVLGLNIVLKGLEMSCSSYIRLRNRVGCHLSMLSLCRTAHPLQLLQQEVKVLKDYCADERFLHWPLASVFHQMIRDKAAFFSIHTFYKYTSMLNIRRVGVASRRKNHATGIRADRPLQILHADSKVFRTADQQKNYIHLVQDNFSRAILGFVESKECSARNMFETLSSVIKDHYSQLVLNPVLY